MKEIKKLEHCKPHKFKRKANEDQHKFNMKLGHSSMNWRKILTTRSGFSVPSGALERLCPLGKRIEAVHLPRAEDLRLYARRLPLLHWPALNSNPKPFSLLCPLHLRFAVPIWAVVLLAVNLGIGVLPVRRWPNSSVLPLQSDFKITINQVLLIPFLIIMIWLWKRKMTVLQMVILFHFVMRFILSFWIPWAIHSLRLIFPVSPRCEEGLNSVFLSGVL